jgi:hypothetical protein
MNIPRNIGGIFVRHVKILEESPYANNRLFIIFLCRRVRKTCKKRLLALSCPSVRMKQLGSNWTDFG